MDVLRTLGDASVDSIVTDPPYHLTQASRGGHARTNNPEMPHGRHRIGDKGFMGKVWDGGDIAQRVELWEECLRVLKPGGHLLAFAGSRTYHRMTCAIEDAGFEVRDQIMWIYGSGFPKSRNLHGEHAGWGSAIKPAHEPICMARKPMVGTLLANVLANGTGALNIYGCRIGEGLGRWPANVIHDGSDEVLERFPDAPGQLADVSYQAGARTTQNVYGAMNRAHEPSAERVYTDNGGTNFAMKPGARRLDAGTAARFFYCAKASRADRNEGIGGSETPVVQTEATMRDRETADWPERNGNFHPTVKPTDLMAYLCRLVTPPNGLVLDPFMGSGSTGKAAMREGFRFIGIDMTPEYIDIARARISHELARTEEVERLASMQQDLFATA
ncbi:site-specific DNA-methyltransferase [Paraburkholderia sp. BL6665CI2N2]|uniref:DNA-methyltransferase n=1 Tax=Paraburkholderia sp. BL6665CI2N2 TaxID=1938806 RepID=UPI001FBB6093|nr:site-specific DNA-methyltransferase [Paraburkholderia sp. BL6665CI2N2]